MQVIGLCRFSYPAIGGFQVEHKTIEERIAYLYAHERLESRFRLFETVALPCLKQQTDGDFDLIIVIGDQLPKHCVDRLHDLTADMPQIQIQAHPPHQQRNKMKAILNAARRYPKEGCLQFRYDDDDAVSVDFIARLREAAQDSAPLLSKYSTVAFDWNNGYVAEMSGAGIAATQIYRTLYVASLGMHIWGGKQLTIMNYAHEKINRFMPVLSFGEEPMWVRTHNGFNDSRQKPVKPIAVTPLTPEQEKDFATRFAIDADRIRRVFSTPG